MIPIAKPFLGEEEAAAAREAILSGWVTQGPRVSRFESAFSEVVSARYSVAVSNCTAALHLALLAVGVRPGDVVLTVSHSFIATANAVRACGAEPVFVDIEPDGFNMSPHRLAGVLADDCEKRIDGLYYRRIERLAGKESPLRPTIREASGARVAAILPVHQMGFPAEMTGILEIAGTYDLPVVEDAACAIGSEIWTTEKNGFEPIGRPDGRLACFSFHPRKILTTGDGGMITTDDPKIDRTLRLLRQHGMSVPDTVRHGAAEVIIEDYVVTGFNYRMTDIQAAVGIEQLKRLGALIRERRDIAAAYASRLADVPGITLIRTAEGTRPNWQSYPVRLEKASATRQKEVMQRMLDQGVATRQGIMNAHQELAYRGSGWVLPESEKRRNETILLPLFPGMTGEQVDTVAGCLKQALEK